MKKYNLLKAIGITFLIVVVMSWLIPAGAYSSGTYTALGKTAPLGLADLSRAPMVGITQLAVIGVIFLLIGGLYGVLNKTGAYTSIVEKLVEKVKTKKVGFLIFTVIFFALLSSLTGSAYVLFALVPFFVTVILLLNYNKMIAFTTTVGAILVGRIGSTYGSTVSNYLNGYFSLDANNQIIVKFILLAILTALLVFFIIKTAKDNTDKKVETAKKIEEEVTKK